MTSVKLSFGSFNAASLEYASSEIEIFRVPMAYVHTCMRNIYVL